MGAAVNRLIDAVGLDHLDAASLLVELVYLAGCTTDERVLVNKCDAEESLLLPQLAHNSRLGLERPPVQLKVKNRLHPHGNDGLGIFGYRNS